MCSNLIEANLTGHDSHGIGMLPRYADSYLEGGLKPNVHVRTVLDAGAMLRLDGQAGFGQVVGHEAMALGIERARQLGCCVMALGNAHHLGRIGAWAEQAAAAGLVSLHFVNVISRGIVAPHGGSDARFGTNPFTAAIPLKGRAPMILDFATSVIAQGKTRVAHNKGEQVPPDHLIDDEGRPTQDPRYSVIEPFGAILTFGAHKGYGMAVLCELLGGALAAGMTQYSDDTSKKRVLNGMLTRADRSRQDRRPGGLRTRGAGVRRLGHRIAAARRLRPRAPGRRARARVARQAHEERRAGGCDHVAGDPQRGEQARRRSEEDQRCGRCGGVNAAPQRCSTCTIQCF